MCRSITRKNARIISAKTSPRRAAQAASQATHPIGRAQGIMFLALTFSASLAIAANLPHPIF
jgi:hypothetical protein